MPPRTIQEVLTGPVPAFVLDVNTSISPRPVQTWMKVNPKDVKCWEDFNLTNLRNAYGHIFDLPCLVHTPVYHVPPQFVIRNLDELRQHGIETLHRLLRFPLQHGIPKLKESLVCSKNEVLCDYKAPHTQTDWIWGVFYTMDKTNLVVSCSRLSNTFTSMDLRLKKPDAIYTLRQLATYAVIGKTRYGFILTDQEVVIVRFYKSSRNVEEYEVEWEAVPWNVSGKDRLTAPLAVFSLVLMSLNDDQRHIVAGNKTLPLDAWIREKPKARDGKFIFRHSLSGLCLDKVPEGIRCYWEPTKRIRNDGASIFDRAFRGH